MNAETLLVEAWLKAGNACSDEIRCPDAAMLGSLVSSQLSEEGARRFTLHLACCLSCRRALAQFIAVRASPSAVPVALVDLLSRGEVTEEWRAWLRGLVEVLPSDVESDGDVRVAGYRENSLARIDDAGRLIVDLEPNRSVPRGARVRFSLASEGAHLELCNVVVRSGRLQAVVDLAAFRPRPGILRPGVLEAGEVHVADEAAAILPILARLQDEAICGTEFWDRFAPAAAAGDRLAATLTVEIADERDQTTVAPRLLGSGARPPNGAGDKTPIGRVQYALDTLEDYASLWKECNGRDLEGAALCATQLRAVLSPERDLEVDRPASPEASVEHIGQTVVVPRARGESL